MMMVMDECPIKLVRATWEGAAYKIVLSWQCKCDHSARTSYCYYHTYRTWIRFVWTRPFCFRPFYISILVRCGIIGRLRSQSLLNQLHIRLSLINMTIKFSAWRMLCLVQLSWCHDLWLGYSYAKSNLISNKI